MSKNIKMPFMAALAMTAASPFSAAAQDADHRVTVSVPLIVDHFHTSRKGWNEGVGENLGLIVEVDRPVLALSDTADLRVGATVGAYRNSVWNTSVIVGATVQVEQRIGRNFALQAGMPIGIVTGYGDVKPALAPYVGITGHIDDRTTIGFRAQWLPNKTAPELFGMKPGSTDAVVGLVTLSRSF